eukprot:Gb_40736 [translate_table: standard]
MRRLFNGLDLEQKKKVLNRGSLPSTSGMFPSDLQISFLTDTFTAWYSSVTQNSKLNKS